MTAKGESTAPPPVRWPEARCRSLQFILVQISPPEAQAGRCDLAGPCAVRPKPDGWVHQGLVTDAQGPPARQNGPARLQVRLSTGRDRASSGPSSGPSAGQAHR